MGTRTTTLAILLLASLPAFGENWPRWRGPDGGAYSTEVLLPSAWSSTENVRWKIPLSGEGISSPIVWDDWVFATTAEEKGAIRHIHCFDRLTGKFLWKQGLKNPNPEHTTATTGHAASTPATDGAVVIAFFGNGGILCCSVEGKILWHVQVPEFETIDGFTGSPIIVGDLAIVVCDHRGQKPASFLLALDRKTGKEVWRTPRAGLERSWSTPILAPAPNVKQDLIVAAQKEVRAYDPETGKQLWEFDGPADWVNPTPVYGFDNLVIAGKGAPLMGINLERKAKFEAIQQALGGEKPEKKEQHAPKEKKTEKDELAEQPSYLWELPKDSPHYGFPVLVKNLLFLVSEDGWVACFDLLLKVPYFKEKLEGKFTASPVAGNGMVYVTNDAGTTYVLKAESKFEVLETNKLGEPTWAVPAISHHCLFLRSDKNLWCIERKEKK